MSHIETVTIQEDWRQQYLRMVFPRTPADELTMILLDGFGCTLASTPRRFWSS
jgi:hypothetical protein